MIFTDFIKIRDELSELAYNNNSYSTAAASAINDVTQAASAVSGTCQIANQFITQNGSTLSITPIIEGALDPSLSVSINYADIENHLGDVLPNSSYTIGDIFQTTSDTGDLYSALAMITQKYSYSNRLTLTDLNAIIDSVNYQSGTSYDISDLKNQLLSVSTSDGYVSNKAWLMAMSNWIKSCKDGADNQSPELDNTSPNVLSGLYSIIQNAISITLSALFTALGVIFNGIWILIGTAFSKLFETLVKGLNSSGDIHPEASNMFAKGVAISHQELTALDGHPFSYIAPYVRDDYSINYEDLFSCGSFYWQGDTSKAVKMNAYIAPSISPRVADEWINSISIDSIEINRNTSYTYYTYYIKKKTNILLADTSEHVPVNKGMRMNEEEAMRCSSDIVYYSKCVCVSEFVRWLNYTTKTTYFNGVQHDTMLTLNSDPDVTIPLGWGSIDAYYRVIYFGFVEWLRYRYPNDDLGPQWVPISDTNIVDAVNRFIVDSFSMRDNFSDVNALYYYGDINAMQIDYHSAAFISRNVLITDAYDSQLTENSDDFATGVIMQFSDNGSSIIAGPYFFWNHNSTSRIYKANSLPLEFCAEFSSLTSDALWAIMMTISLVAISAAVVSLKVSKATRLKKIKKSMMRTKKISDAKTNWENTLNELNPETGEPYTQAEQKQALDSYVKEVDKFNRLGKIFHWGSYDAANSWVDYDTGGSSEPTSMTNVLSVVDSAKQATNRLLGYEEGSSIDPSDTILAKLNEIINLIR